LKVYDESLDEFVEKCVTKLNTDIDELKRKDKAK